MFRKRRRAGLLPEHVGQTVKPLAAQSAGRGNKLHTCFCQSVYSAAVTAEAKALPAVPRVSAGGWKAPLCRQYSRKVNDAGRAGRWESLGMVAGLPSVI